MLDRVRPARLEGLAATLRCIRRGCESTAVAGSLAVRGRGVDSQIYKSHGRAARRGGVEGGGGVGGRAAGGGGWCVDLLSVSRTYERAGIPARNLRPATPGCIHHRRRGRGWRAGEKGLGSSSFPFLYSYITCSTETTASTIYSTTSAGASLSRSYRGAHNREISHRPRRTIPPPLGGRVAVSRKKEGKKALTTFTAVGPSTLTLKEAGTLRTGQIRAIFLKAFEEPFYGSILIVGGGFLYYR